MILTPTLTLSVFAMLSLQPRLAERALADMAVIRIPRMVKEEMYKGVLDEQAGRLTFSFSTSYFWASFGSSTAYKHMLFVSLMAPDASDAEYAAWPTRFTPTYDNRKTIRTSTVGSGTLTITEGIYRQNTLQEPSHTFLYVDRARRLQIAWHAVKKEVDLATGAALVDRMVASFRMVREPAAEFKAIRDRPGKEAEDRARKRALALEMLSREGYGTPQPGTPVFRNDVYLEWTTDPEPRFQLLLPLGRVRIAAGASPGLRPRPVRLSRAAGTAAEWPGSVGWRELADGQWEVSNNENAYLPFVGIAAALAAESQDPAFVYFYYAATVRVEESADDRLTGLRWFFDGLPEVRRLWREGKLVTGGTPEND
jgi:hypothetical protein